MRGLEPQSKTENNPNIDTIFAPSAAAPVPVEYLTLCWTNPTEEELKPDSSRCPYERGKLGFQFFFC